MHRSKLPELGITPEFCILGAVLLLTVPLPWIGAAILGAAVHELGHVLAIRALGGEIRSLQVGSAGASMEIGGLSPLGELAAAAAGPGASLLLMLGIRSFPRLAVCGAVQGCFNLLPIYPLDGGRILCCSLRCFVREQTAARILKVVRRLTLLVLSAGACYFCHRFSASTLPAFLAAFLLIKMKSGKIPCKQTAFRVQ